MFRYGMTSYRNDLVILDVMKDQFSIVPDLVTSDEWRINHDIIINCSPDLSGFFSDDHFIGTTADAVSNSFLEERWIMPVSAPPSQSRGLLRKYLLLFRVLYFSKQITNKGIPWICLHSKKTEFNNQYSGQEKTAIINFAINRLSEIFSFNIFKTDCLTFSYTLKKMIEYEKISAKLVIGVRTQPFYSHAWVEVDGVIVNDDKYLRQKLSVIAEI